MGKSYDVVEEMPDRNVDLSPNISCNTECTPTIWNEFGKTNAIGVVGGIHQLSKLTRWKWQYGTR